MGGQALLLAVGQLGVGQPVLPRPAFAVPRPPDPCHAVPVGQAEVLSAHPGGKLDMFAVFETRIVSSFCEKYVRKVVFL